MIDINGLEVGSVEVHTSGGVMIVSLDSARLSDVISADEAVEEFGAAELLDNIGGFEDWIAASNGRVDADEVAEWLAEQGYNVEKQ